MTSWRKNILLLLLAAVLITAPIIIFGIPKGNDLPQHFQFAVVFRDSLAHGVLYPSWASDVNSGFGDVGVRFYPPAAYYLLVLLRAVSNNWAYATAATVCALFFVGAVGVYLWCREWFGPRASLIGGSLYVFVPYHVNEIYNAFTFAEFAAACVLPFCFLCVTRVLKRGKLVDSIGLAVSLALLILTHLPLAVIGSMSLVAYVLAFWIKDRGIVSVAHFFGSVCAGLFLSAFYWVRMLSELGLVNHTGEGFISGDYDFRNNFVWSFFYSPAEQYSERSLGFLDLMLFVTLAMAIVAGVFFYRRVERSKRGPVNALLTVLAAAIFFATPLSAPIWERVDFLQRTQFPWRWMATISLVCSVFVAAGAEQINGLGEPALRRIAMVLGGTALVSVTFTVAQVIRPAIFLEPVSFDQTVDALATANSCECWWPIWAKKAALSEATRVAGNGRKITIESWEATDRIFQVSAGDSDMVRVATFYYPNWHARVNGRDAPVSHDDNGAIVVPIPTEDSKVELYFQEPKITRIATYFSAAAWLIFAAFGLSRAVTAARIKLR